MGRVNSRPGKERKMAIFAYIVDFYNEIEGNTTTEHGYICGECYSEAVANLVKQYGGEDNILEYSMTCFGGCENGILCGRSLDDSFAWFDKKLSPR